jgi:tyrosine aminotransferase
MNSNDFQLKTGLVKLSQLILGANTVAQSVIEEALHNTPQSYYDDLSRKLEANAKCLVSKLSGVTGLKVVSPKGAMYMMLGIEPKEFADIPDDVEFARLLLEEELVLVLPGKIFRVNNFVRLVICPPVDKLEEAANRIISFVERHRKVTRLILRCFLTHCRDLRKQ